MDVIKIYEEGDNLKDMVALTLSARWKPSEKNLRFSREEGIVPQDYNLEILSFHPTGPPYQFWTCQPPPLPNPLSQLLYVSWFCFSGEL